jgi:hypothetical protein
MFAAAQQHYLPRAQHTWARAPVPALSCGTIKMVIFCLPLNAIQNHH